MKKIMLFEGDIETQGYFSIQLAEAFQKMGHQTYIFDLSRPWSSTNRFFKFFEKGNTVLINFNFHGMSGEEIFLDENADIFSHLGYHFRRATKNEVKTYNRYAGGETYER